MAALMLFGHGASIEGDTFDFRRTGPNASKIYFWAMEGKSSRSYSNAMDSIIANNGTVPTGWAQEKSSRIGGTLLTDHLLQDPTVGTDLIPWLPANFATLAHNTAIPALNGTVFHDAATIAASQVMVFYIDAGQPELRLSDILADANFNARPLDIVWLVCRDDI